MKVSNYTGQVLLGMGVALLAALFVLIRNVLRHWHAWHVPLILLCVAGLVMIFRKANR